MSARIRIGLVGMGQIARTAHVPAIANSPHFRLVAAAHPIAIEVPDGVALYESLDAMLAAAGVDAVALCTPPQIRGELARRAIAAGVHVLLEKPPAATATEAHDLGVLGERAGVSVFAAWHSMFAAGVEPARRILAERGVAGMRIVWYEDVTTWHPGAAWFWEPGGLGVFDPGINALSIAVRTMPEPFFITESAFDIAPGAHTPWRARLSFATASRATGLSAAFDWRHSGEEIWDIAWELADGGRLALSRGGAALALDGRCTFQGAEEEYPLLYAHFAGLIASRRSDVETRPLALAAEAFLLART